MDVRKHTRHVLRPDAESVQRFLANPTDAEFRRFAEHYERTLEQRFRKERPRFDELADLAEQSDVYLGCNCPTRTNPDVRHCHTVLALAFMKKKYPKLHVQDFSSVSNRRRSASR
jgi:uncharacterized protein YeaO (DUF488 family)